MSTNTTIMKTEDELWSSRVGRKHKLVAVGGGEDETTSPSVRRVRCR